MKGLDLEAIENMRKACPCNECNVILSLIRELKITSKALENIAGPILKSDLLTFAAAELYPETEQPK